MTIHPDIANVIETSTMNDFPPITPGELAAITYLTKENTTIMSTIRRIRRFASSLILVALIVLMAAACQTDTSSQGVIAGWECAGKGRYQVTIVNGHKTEAWDVSTQADPYIVLLVPGGVEKQVHNLPPSKRPWVKVYGASGQRDEILIPNKPLTCG